MESTSTLANQMQSLSLEPKISYKELRTSFNDAFVSLADLNFICNGDNFGDGIFYYQWLRLQAGSFSWHWGAHWIYRGLT